jgi:hypothetical protein
MGELGTRASGRPHLEVVEVCGLRRWRAKRRLRNPLDSCIVMHKYRVHEGAPMHVSSETLAIAASISLLVFVLLSAVDGIYIHLIRLRLHARPESWREHVWHTGRAILFPPILAGIFSAMTGGLLLWAGVVFVLLDQVCELLDVFSESKSRAGIGGLGSFEYALHGTLTTARAAGIALSLAARPAAAWALSAPLVISELPGAWGIVVRQLIPGAVIAAGIHAWLAVKHRPRPATVRA